MMFLFAPSAGWKEREHRLIAFGEVMEGAVQIAAETVGSVVETSAESFSSNTETLNGFASNMVDSGVNTACSASDSLNSGLSSTLSFCEQFGDLGSMAESAAGGLGDMVKGGGETLASGVESGAGMLGDVVEDIGDSFFGPLGSVGGSVAKSTIEGGGGVIAGGIRSGAETMGNTISHVPATLGQMAGGMGLPDILDGASVPTEKVPASAEPIVKSPEQAAPVQQQTPSNEKPTTWQQIKIEKYHDWIMNPKDHADLDRAVSASDAINGDDKALQRFITEDQKKSGMFTGIAKKTYKWWKPIHTTQQREKR